METEQHPKEIGKTEESLTCGASLAEGEHYYCSQAPAISVSPDLKSVESLRDWIASDIVTTGHVQNEEKCQTQCYSTFTSPFEKQTVTGTSTCQHQHYTIPLVYCDQTASNRPVRSIEKYLQKHVLPLYGNTHTNTSVTGSQTTAFVAEARQIIAESVNAKITGKAACDVVLFAGNGATATVELLIDCLGIKHHHPVKNHSNDDSDKHRPVVFVGPYEHHSNLIPWRESGCEIVMVPEDPITETVDLRALERLLQQYPSSQTTTNTNTHRPRRSLLMGTFSAASNVTGKLSDTRKIAALLHKYGALAFFDYATAAPYLSKIDMDMNPVVSSPRKGQVEQEEEEVDASKDAMFLSGHKWLGGVGTPGILVVKKHCVSQINPPGRSGGGTVWYVTSQHHRFLSNRVERYEGGTPHITGIVRAGLTFLLKRQVEECYQRIIGPTEQNEDRREIRQRKVKEDEMNARCSQASLQDLDCNTHRQVVSYLREHAPNLVLLGVNKYDQKNRHLPIFSFLIRFQNKKFLHYNYVCAILNDVFGIQSRGGCQCAGPYSQQLLGLTERRKVHGVDVEVPNVANRDIEQALLHFKERAELLRPGYTRISLPFKGLRTIEVDYVLKALVWISNNGWALMCQYRCNHRTGEWRHASRQGKPLGTTERKWLSHYDVLSLTTHNDDEPTARTPANLETMLQETLDNADSILQAAKLDQRSIAQALKMVDAESVLGQDGDEKLESLRWYVYPKECAVALTQPVDTSNCHDRVPCTINPQTFEMAGFKVEAESVWKNGIPVNGYGLPTKRQAETVDQECRLEESMRQHDPIHVSGLFFFRDGEYCGEATIEEIHVGFDDGELSGSCEIFDHESDTWMPLPDFLQPKRPKMEAHEGQDCHSSHPQHQHLRLLGESHAGVNRTDAIGESTLDDELSDHRSNVESNSTTCLSFESTNPGNEAIVTHSAHDVPQTATGARTVLPSTLNFRDNNRDGQPSIKQTPACTESGELSRKRSVIDPESERLQPISDNPLTNEENNASTSDDPWHKKGPRSSATWGLGTIVTAAINTARDGNAIVKDSELGVSKDVSPVKQGNSAGQGAASKKRFRHITPPKKMMRFATQALIQWDMIQEGDKLLLGLSGGKDSLSLLHCLMEFQRKLPTKFEIEVCTIDPITPSFDPSPLIPYVESLGLKYHYIRDDIMARAQSAGKDGKVVSSLCAFCARMKRGHLYTCARQNHCNKLVLAQHLDDCAESFMMSAMHNGFLRTMKANYEIDAGDLSVIRPLIYCRESLMTDFAKSAKLPVINENCPACFEEPKERARIKKMLSREETLYPTFYDNMRRALLPLMHDDTSAILRCYAEEILAKSRKEPGTRDKQGKNKSKDNMTETKGTGAGSSLVLPNNGEGETIGSKCIHEASDEELIKELARRRAMRNERRQYANGNNGNESMVLANQTCSRRGKCEIFE